MAGASISRRFEHPAVAALQKKIRGEALTEAEEALLQNATRKPGLVMRVPHASVMAELAERERRGR